MTAAAPLIKLARVTPFLESSGTIPEANPDPYAPPPPPGWTMYSDPSGAWEKTDEQLRQVASVPNKKGKAACFEMRREETGWTGWTKCIAPRIRNKTFGADEIRETLNNITYTVRAAQSGAQRTTILEATTEVTGDATTIHIVTSDDMAGRGTGYAALFHDRTWVITPRTLVWTYRIHPHGMDNGNPDPDLGASTWTFTPTAKRTITLPALPTVR